MMREISLLGSTGSIGQSALRVVDEYPGRFSVKTLVCGSNLALLSQQIAKYKPSYVAVSSKEACVSDEYRNLKESFPDTTFFEGSDGVLEAANIKADICLSAIVGSAGLAPTLAALPHVGRVALANKETLVMAGDLFLMEAHKHGTEIVPVDSEHSAIFALLRGSCCTDMSKIVLTASGGSLRDLPLEKIPETTVEEALAHPTWNMGSKITIDSATLMNKGLEVIEAHYLFDVAYENIDIIIHPESVIHSMVKSFDGSFYAHMGVADMAYPIASALLHPECLPNTFEELDLAKIGSLSFRELDHKRYPVIELCYEAGKRGGSMPAVLNAANEVAVQAFLDRKISFTTIVSTVEKTVAAHHYVAQPNLEQLYQSDRWARETAAALCTA